MIPNVNELYRYLNEKIPMSLSCDWDNDGLMVAADGNRKVNKILLTLDVTKDVVKVAKELSCDVIISHHPLIFKPLASVNDSDSTSEIVICSLLNGISVMSFHTRLDALKDGVNDVLAERIGVKDASEFGPEDEEIGRIGVLDGEMTPTDFALKVKDVLGADSVKLTDANKPVKTVALLGGRGKDYVLPAKLAGADVFVTGEITYNTAVTAKDSGISVIEAGHYFTEVPVLDFLEKLIEQAFPTVTVERAVSNPTVTL